MDASRLKITKTTSPKAKLPKEELKFGQTFSDHMLVVDWDKEAGWHAPQIMPYGPFSIDPAASVFHYAMECFEGMKAYLDDQGQVRLFRPDMNMARFNRSMQRLFLPTFNGDEFQKCIVELLKVDKDWIPRGEGYSMYLRPTGISTHPYLGVGPAEFARAYCILSPVGPYYPEGFKPVKLLATDKYCRAFPGGTGDTKIGGNYGPTILPQMEAAKEGYTQVLWLFGEDHLCTEVGTMNLFFFLVNEKGERELVTAALTTGDILPGVTRDSILTLMRGWGEFHVSERAIPIAEIVKAHDEGRLLEAFGSGTAAVLSPIEVIGYKGKTIHCPLNAPSGMAGELCQRLWDEVVAIQYGRKEHPWSVVTK